MAVNMKSLVGVAALAIGLLATSGGVAQASPATAQTAQSAQLAQSAQIGPDQVAHPGGTTVEPARRLPIPPDRYGKHYISTWGPAPSYRYPWTRSSRVKTGGYLQAGSNYVYCQDKGSHYTRGKYKNTWWLYTDDDSHNANVWVSAVYATAGSNYGRIPGVPQC